MAVVMTIYNPFKEYVNEGVIIFGTDTIKLALVASTYAINANHGIWADVSADEVASGSGYTTGGASLTGVTWTRSGGTCTLDANDVSFTTLTKTFRYGVLYANVTRNDPAAVSIVNPLIAVIQFDDTPADVVVTATTWPVVWSSLGILTQS